MKIHNIMCYDLYTKTNIHNLCKDHKKKSTISIKFPQAHGFTFWK